MSADQSYRHLQLGNLIALYDDNHVSIDGMLNFVYFKLKFLDSPQNREEDYN